MMDRTSALLILGTTKEDELDEVWEERLFEHKQFFLTKPPILEVWKARLDKLQKQYQAYCYLDTGETYELYNIETQESRSEGIGEQDILAVFNKHFATRSEFKLKLNRSFDVLEIINLVHEWILAELDYAQKLYCEEAIKDEERKVVLSKEPDPMELLDAIKLWKNEAGEENSKNLCLSYSFLPEILKNEVKRLTSLYKRSI